MYYLVKVKFTEDVFSKSKGVTEKITTSQFLVAAESVSDNTTPSRLPHRKKEEEEKKEAKE